MNKTVKLCATIGLTFSCGAALFTSTLVNETKASEAETYYVDFFNNYLREEIELSNGFTGKGNNVIYQTVSVAKDSLVTKPTDPTRKNYEFSGWFLEKEGETAWNFDVDKVAKDTRLFAKWTFAQEEVEPEPEYTPPSTVLDESAEVNYVIDSIMYFKLTGDTVRVSAAALMKLEANKDNVLPLMEYRVKETSSITATYANNKITVQCSGVEDRVINVVSAASQYIMNNSSYESKAASYESKALEEESHHVMLAGSSSIEFWTTSKEDMDPIVSYNHGIGGTTIEEWTEKLNPRLVYPYKPKMAVYYVGINNVINTDDTAEVIWNKLETFFNETHAALPDTKIQYILMNLIPGFKTFYDTINFVNAKAVEYQSSNSSWLTLINPGVALLKENGEPNAAYFRVDGLHLSNYGYVVWGGIVKESILNGLLAM